MPKEIKLIQNQIEKQIRFLQDTYHVRRIGVFGSLARGKGRKTSDVDILVEFSKPIGFFKFLELEEFLSKTLGRKVDLVTKRALKPALKQGVLQEVIYV